MNFFNGDQLTKYEIKQRLTKMDIPFDNKIIDKRYFATLYNKAMLDEANRLKIKDELTNDNSFKLLRRSPSQEEQEENSNGSLKQKYAPKYPIIHEEPFDDDKESNAGEKNQSKNKQFESLKSASNERRSTSSMVFSNCLSFGLGFGSIIAYQNINAQDMKAFIDKLPSANAIIQKIRDIFIPLKNFTLFFIDMMSEFAKPYAQTKYAQLLAYVTHLKIEDIAFIVLLSLFVIIAILSLRKMLCKRKEKPQVKNNCLNEM